MYFATIAIIPGDTEQNEYEVKEAVNDLLIPYWKHLEHCIKRPQCRCVGSLSMKDSDEYLKGFFKLEEVRGHIEDFGIVPEVRPNYFPVLEFMAKRRLEYFNEYWSYRYEPDPECPICGGTGYDITYYNPNTKWDAYVIGGRFDGKIWGPERFEEHQEARINARKAKINNPSGYKGNTTEDFLPHFKDRHVEDNCRLVSEIPIEKSVYAPYALVTPDGKWHEEGDFTKEVFYTESVNEQWHELLKTEFAKYPTHLAVFLDCQRS